MKKITITEKQARQFNLMRFCLLTIGKNYQTPAQLRRDSQKEYGIDFEESIEMAYENIQETAKKGYKGVKEIVV